MSAIAPPDRGLDNLTDPTPERAGVLARAVDFDDRGAAQSDGGLEPVVILNALAPFDRRPVELTDTTPERPALSICIVGFDGGCSANRNRRTQSALEGNSFNQSKHNYLLGASSDPAPQCPLSEGFTLHQAPQIGESAASTRSSVESDAQQARQSSVAPASPPAAEKGEGRNSKCPMNLCRPSRRAPSPETQAQRASGALLRGLLQPRVNALRRRCADQTGEAMDFRPRELLREATPHFVGLAWRRDRVDPNRLRFAHAPPIRRSRDGPRQHAQPRRALDLCDTGQRVVCRNGLCRRASTDRVSATQAHLTESHSLLQFLRQSAA